MKIRGDFTREMKIPGAGFTREMKILYIGFTREMKILAHKGNEDLPPITYSLYNVRKNIL